MQYVCLLQCLGVINLGGEVGCMISEGPWIFVGIPNAVKVGQESLLTSAYCCKLLYFTTSFIHGYGFLGVEHPS